MCICQTIIITRLLHHFHMPRFYIIINHIILYHPDYALDMVYDSPICVICVSQTFNVVSRHNQVVSKSIHLRGYWYAKEASDPSVLLLGFSVIWL